MREARGFAVVKLSVTSTDMLNLYNGYLNRIGVVVRGAKAQHHENKIKKERGYGIKHVIKQIREKERCESW